MEFDKSKILTVVTADQLKDGQMGWISDYVGNLEIQARDSKPSHISLSKNDKYPFMDECKNFSLYFYPAPEPTYAERQAQWVKENNVKIGTRVHITREFSSEDLSHDCFWNDKVDKTIGLEGTVTRIDKKSMEVKTEKGSWCYPYFALEVVKEPAYRPFKNAEEFKPYRDEWFRVKNGCGVERVSFYDNTGVMDSIGKFITYKKFFETGERENGEPCGVKVE